MTDYSALVALFLMLPVLMQIVLPLVMLAVFGLMQMMKVVFWRRKAVVGSKDVEKGAEEMQPSRM
jgi:hypothetical protein